VGKSPNNQSAEEILKEDGIVQEEEAFSEEETQVIISAATVLMVLSKERIETLECALADAHKTINRLQNTLTLVKENIGFHAAHTKDLIDGSMK
jgi:hypothetical protein